MALPMPSLFPILGANRENVAKVNKGRVVRNPAQPLEIPKSSLINGIKGPTDAMEVRRLIEIKMIPVISKDWEEMEFFKKKVIIGSMS